MALGAWLLLALAPAAVAHPIPDVPLRSFFEADGSAVIKIELETRCFSQDPVGEPYLFPGGVPAAERGGAGPVAGPGS